MGLPKLWGKDSSGNHGFAFSHVKTIYYNWSSKKLLSTKLSEMDTATNNRILKSDISNVQVNNANKVPSSALVYGMNNQISELNARGETLTLTMDKWLLAHYVRGWGLVVPLVVYQPTQLENTESSYQVFDNSGTWVPAYDAIIYSLNLGGYNTFIHLESSGSFTDGETYLCKIGMKLS